MDQIILANVGSSRTASATVARAIQVRPSLAKDIARILPVIVTVHAIPESTPIWNGIRTMLTQHGLFHQSNCRARQRIDIEDVEIIEVTRPSLRTTR